MEEGQLLRVKIRKKLKLWHISSDGPYKDSTVEYILEEDEVVKFLREKDDMAIVRMMSGDDDGKQALAYPDDLDKVTEEYE